MNPATLLRVLAVYCLFAVCLYGDRVRAADAPAAPRGKSTLRIAAAQPRNRTIDFRLTPAAALEQVNDSLGELERLVDKAGVAGCDALALPEDTLGLLKWEV